MRGIGELRLNGSLACLRARASGRVYEGRVAGWRRKLGFEEVVEELAVAREAGQDGQEIGRRYQGDVVGAVLTPGGGEVELAVKKSRLPVGGRLVPLSARRGERRG